MGGSKGPRKPAKCRTIQKCFESGKRCTQKSPPPSQAPSSAASCAGSDDGISREQRSGFLTYLRSAMSSKDNERSSQAGAILDEYRTLDATGKKAMIAAFFKQGGKRSGLKSVYDQRLSVSSSSTDKTWQGYLTPKGIMKLYEVTMGTFTLCPPNAPMS